MSHSMQGSRGQMRWHARPPKKDATIAKLAATTREQKDELARIKAERDSIRQKLEQEKSVGVLGRLARNVRRIFTQRKTG